VTAELAPGLTVEQLLADPTRALIGQEVGAIEQRDPDLARTVRACALPRRLDAILARVVRGLPEDAQDVGQLLDALRALSFVTETDSGEVAVDDAARDVLLTDLRATDPDYFAAVNERLRRHYLAEHDAGLQLEADLALVAGMIRENNYDRYRRLVATVRDGMRDALIEAFHHAGTNSTRDLYALFETTYFAHEASAHNLICGALVDAAETELQRADPGEAEMMRPWLRYWRARHARVLGRLDEAEAGQRRLLADVSDDPRLRTWALSELALVYQNQFRYREMLGTYLQEAEEGDVDGVDRWNRPLAYLNIGAAYRQLGMVSDAIDALDTALVAAADVRNPGAEVYTRLELAECFVARADIAAAAGHVIHALDLGRTVLRTDRQIALGVVRSFMSLVATDAPELADALWREAAGLGASLVDPEAEVGPDLTYAALARERGRLRAATEVLAAAHRRSAELEGTVTAELLLFNSAQLSEAHSDFDGAIATYLTLEKEANPWNRAAALSNRAHAQVITGAWADAAEALSGARSLWEQMGNDHLALVIDVWLAEMECRRGDAEQATRLLDAVEPGLRHLDSHFLIDVELTRARIAHVGGDISSAVVHEERAAHRANLGRDRVAEATALSRLAELESSRGGWANAARWAQRAHEQLTQLADCDAYRPSKPAQEASAANARAAVLMSNADDGSGASLTRARAFLRVACDSPQAPFWYWLNLAYVCSNLQEWAEAADAMDAALAAAPATLRVQLLYDRALEWRRRQAARLADAHELEAAVEILDRARAAFADAVSAEQLAVLAVEAGDDLLRLERADEAEERFASAAALQGGDGSGELRLRFALLAAIRGSVEEAGRELELALDDSEPDGLWSMLGVCARLTPHGPPPALGAAAQALLRNPQVGGHMTRFESELTLPLPPDWVARDTLTLVSPDGRANVTASSEPVDPDTTTEQFATSIGASLADGQFPGYHEISSGPTDTVDGEPAWLRRFDWSPPDSERVSQLQLYFARGGRVYTLTATSTADDNRMFEQMLTEMLRSVVLRSPSSLE